MVKHKILHMETREQIPTFINIRPQVLEFVKESGIKNGILSVQSPHTTCSVLFEEMVHDTDIKGQEYLQVDLNHGLSKIFPKQESDDYYYRYPGPKHQAFGVENDPAVANDMITILNADGHLKASLIGASETFSLIDGELQIGQWGYIYFIDWDTCRARSRKCILTLIGE
ncbi:MAG: YjbQ family protein [Lachnospiraceae bacterium]|nr:YjbQ family protein [Lachnospiraceae bacterium]